MKSGVRNKKENLRGWLLTSPYLIYTLLMFVIPLVWALWLSTMNWNLMSDNRVFVGAENFQNLFKDPAVEAAFKNSFKYTLAIVPLCVLFGLIIAVVINELPSKMRGVVSVVTFIPYLTSGVATAIVAKYMFSYNSVLNQLLRSQGVQVSWFANPVSAFWIIVGIIVWKCSGYYALFFLSGLASISQEMLEAASIDGANAWQRFIHIKLPMMIPTFQSVITMAAGLALGIYTEPYLLTSGGPSRATTTWTLEIYYAAFTKFQSGYGTAMAIIYAVEIFLLLQLINWIMKLISKKYGPEV